MADLNKEMAARTVQMAEMKVLDAKRTMHVLDMPPVALVREFERLACTLFGRTVYASAKEKRRRLHEVFGTNSIVIAKLWEMIEASHNGVIPYAGAKKEHLLWGLHLLKDYSTERNQTTALH